MPIGGLRVLMKKILSLSLAFFLIFLSISVCSAQEEDTCKQFRDQIQKLEQLDITNLGPSVREIYKESLLKLYREYTTCLENEISTTVKARQRSNGASAQALDGKLVSLRAEKADTEKKIVIFEIASNLKSSPKPPVESNRAASDVATNAESPAPESEMVAASTVTSSVHAGNGSINLGNGTAPVNNTRMAVGSAMPASQPQDCAASEAYGDPPVILADLVNRAAADAVRRNDPTRAIFPLSQMVLYTVFDAASANSSSQLRGLEAYQYLSETARTDKQLGAAANSEGAVSGIEKPSFARLLGFAIEHGGITKQNDGTNLTLSTSLYSLYAMSGGDTAETYQRAGFLNRIGLSATFAVNDQENELANARRNNLSEWSGKVRLFGDRTTRSARFQRFWNESVRPLIRERLRTLGTSVETLSSQLSSYDAIERVSRRCLPDLVRDRMNSNEFKAATDDQKRQMVADLILGHLRANVFNQVRPNGRLELNGEQVAQIENDFLPRLKTSLDHLVLADAEIKERIADLSKGPLATFAYTNYRIPTGSDYSETKFLFEQDKGLFRPLKLIGNFGLSFYNKPDPFLNQERLRDISAALSFEGSSRSPFTEAENQSRITYSFVGRYQRLFENRRRVQRTPDIGAFQFVMEIPFFKGLSLPLSATYANATEEERKNHFRFNFGMRLDTDKLFELLKAASNR